MYLLAEWRLVLNNFKHLSKLLTSKRISYKSIISIINNETYIRHGKLMQKQTVKDRMIRNKPESINSPFPDLLTMEAARTTCTVYKIITEQ